MLNEIMDGVTGKLKKLFPQYAIDTDEEQTGLIDPYFFVSVLEPKERQLIGRRYFRETKVSVRFFAGNTEEASRYLNNMSEILLDGLEYITLPDLSLLRGTEMQVQLEPVEKTLTLLINYNMFIIKTTESLDAMEALEAEIKKGKVR